VASNFIEILNQLHDYRVDFVIVGGVAAALHGGSRVTFDLHIVPSLSPPSSQAAVELLWPLGARPRIPEPIERIRDVAQVRPNDHPVGFVIDCLPPCCTAAPVAHGGIPA
jgi:hypothetical protein